MRLALKAIPMGLALASLLALSAAAQADRYSCTAQPYEVLQRLAMTNGCGIIRDHLGRDVSACCFLAPEDALVDGPAGQVRDAPTETIDVAEDNAPEVDDTDPGDGESGDDGTNSN